MRCAFHDKQYADGGKMQSKRATMNHEMTNRTYKTVFWDKQKQLAFGMIAPAFIILLFLAIGPMFFMFVNAFRTWKIQASKNSSQDMVVLGRRLI